MEQIRPGNPKPGPAERDLYPEKGDFSRVKRRTLGCPVGKGMATYDGSAVTARPELVISFTTRGEVASDSDL